MKQLIWQSYKSKVVTKKLKFKQCSSCNSVQSMPENKSEYLNAEPVQRVTTKSLS